MEEIFTGKKYNHNCIVCGTGYQHCDVCQKINKWRVIADSLKHYNIHIAIQEHRQKVCSDEDFLDNIRIDGDIESIDDCKDFKPEVYNYIKTVFENVAKNKKKTTLKK